MKQFGKVDEKFYTGLPVVKLTSMSNEMNRLKDIKGRFKNA